MKNLVYLSLGLMTVFTSNAYNIGLCIMATGKYLPYAERLIESARTHFFTEDHVTYFVFTDGQLAKPAPDIVRIEQQRLGWPQDTLMRCAVYVNHKQYYENIDHLYACDADMLFVAPVGREIISDRVATQHPGFIGKRGTYETNAHSKAYVKKNEGNYYVAGGFYGGSHHEFLKLCRHITKNIAVDFKKQIIAIWHDESHLNRYFIDNPPTLLLTPSYCYPESWTLPYTKKLLALDKNHQQLRS